MTVEQEINRDFIAAWLQTKNAKEELLNPGHKQAKADIVAQVTREAVVEQIRLAQLASSNSASPSPIAQG
jgi:hypothetical protein